MTKMYNKIVGLLMSLCLVAGLTACNDEADYEMAAVPSNAQVYFSQNESSTITLSSEGGSFTIPVYRVDTKGELTVPVAFECEQEGVFTFPQTATFADGSNKAELTVAYVTDSLDYDQYVSFTATVDSTLSTPYGMSSQTYSAGVPAPWKTLGYATVRETFFGDFWGIPATYQVPIQENETKPGLYRLVSPYGKYYPYMDEGDYDNSQTYYIEIDATNPDMVLVDFQYTGMDFGYGNMAIISYASYILNNGGSAAQAAAYAGTLQDGIITLPAGTLLMYLPDMGGYYFGNSKNDFCIALPGYVLADYSFDIAYTGYAMENGEYTLTVNAEMGDDVAAVEYYLIESDQLEAFMSGAYDGELALTTSASGKVSIPAEEGKQYLIYAVAYNEDGDYVGYAYDYNFDPTAAEAPARVFKARALSKAKRVAKK